MMLRDAMELLSKSRQEIVAAVSPTAHFNEIHVVTGGQYLVLEQVVKLESTADVVWYFELAIGTPTTFVDKSGIYIVRDEKNEIQYLVPESKGVITIWENLTEQIDVWSRMVGVK